MALQIKKGKQVRAQRVVVHGPEGVGKSSLASGFGRVLFIDAEDSTAQLDVERLEPSNMKEVRQAIEIARKSPDHDAIAIDTVDWIEHRQLAEMLEEDKKSSIEDYGYGAGYTMLSERMMEFLKLLDGLIAAGKHVILLAHSHIRRHEEPGDKGTYDRFELKLSKKGAPLVKEWADAVLFLNFHTLTKESKDKKVRAVGGTDRIIHTSRCAAFDAKNRHGLPEKLNYEDAGKVPAPLLAIITGNTPTPKEANPDAPADPFLMKLVKGYEAAALAVLMERGMLQAGQDFRALKNAHLMRIKAQSESFLDVVKAKHSAMNPAPEEPAEEAEAETEEPGFDKGGEA